MEKAKIDSQVHAQRIAVLAGDAECWINVAGVWFTAIVKFVVGQVATLVTVCGDQHVVPVNEISLECPCRWPV